jgi:hypothetical protein
MNNVRRPLAGGITGSRRSLGGKGTNFCVRPLFVKTGLAAEQACYSFFNTYVGQKSDV